MTSTLRSPRTPVVLAAVAVLASFVYLVANATHYSFVYDEWELLARRPGWSPSAILDPFHEHVIVAPALIYKLVQATVGMTSAMPYYVLAMVTFATAGALLFAFLRVRVGPWLAFCAVLPVLFLGASSEDLLWAFQLGFFGSVAAGLGALLALDRGDRTGDRIACLLLVVALSFSSVGIPFAIAAVVDVLMGPRPRRRRVFVVAVPIALYVVWWIGWGHTAEHHLSLHNLVHLPAYVFDAAGAGVAALCGHEVNDPSDPGHAPLIFRVLAVLVGLVVAVKIARDRRVDRGLAVALTIALAFWMLAGLDRSFGRPPISNRYQYPAAVFILLVLGETLRALRFPRIVTIAALGLSIVATIGGISLLHRERRQWNGFGETVRAALAGVELAGAAARPDQMITTQGINVSVGNYLDAAGSFGSPAYDEAEVRERASRIGSLVDSSFIGAAGVVVRPAGPFVAGVDPCGPGNSGPRPSRIARGSGAFAIANPARRAAVVSASRFGSPATEIGSLPARSTAIVRIPHGTSPRPWHVAVSGAPGAELRLCPPPWRPAPRRSRTGSG